MASCLSKLHISNTNKFESLDWMPEVLVKMYLVYQPKNAHFNLVNVLAEKFDKEIAVNKESSDIYKRVFGVHEISARIDTIALFNSINNKDFAQKIYAFIIENEQEFHLFNALKRTDAYEEWNRIQLYSIILSIVDQIDIDLNLFITRVATDPSPLVRLYIEWIIAYKMLQNPTLSDEMFNELTENYKDIKPTVCLSYKRILFLMIAQLERDTEVDYLSKYINVIIAGATAQKRLIRHFSLSMIISIWNEIERKDLLSMSLLEQKLLDPRLKQLVYTLYQTAVNSEIFTLYRSGDDLIWDIKRDLNLTYIAGANLLRLTDRDDMDFITKEQFEQYLSTDQKEILKRPIGETQDINKLRETYKRHIITPEQAVEQASPLQTKSGAWNSVMNIDNPRSAKDLNRSDLIVVASLVDKPPNLGGICRLSDVLGVGLLTIHDMEVAKHPQFKNVAVTADQWMPMHEVKPEEIKNYLLEKKRDGYTLIGLEQTDKSVQLNKNLEFPKKSLILLGKEKEGIPGELLAELDFCVEIKQVGIIRSMNIQTAAAIIVHAYSSQHC